MKKTVWTFGLISGVIISVMMLVTTPFHDRMGWEKAEIVGYTTMVLAFLLVFFGIRSYRDNVGQGEVTFGRALAVGSLIVVVSSLCYVGTWQLIYYKVSPDFAQKYQAYIIDKAKRDGETPAEIEARMADMKRFEELYRNPAINVAITFVEPLPVGLVIALLSAAVLSGRRRQKASEPIRATGALTQ